MNPSDSPAPAQYIATIREAREVSLVGRADLGYWRDHLAKMELFPLPVTGKAEIIIGAAALRWFGVRFQELTIAMPVSLQEQGTSADGAYLVAAFNTSQLFTFSERLLFRTPYCHGQVNVLTEPHTGLALGEQQHPLIRATRGDHQSPEQVRDDVWEGVVYLPSERCHGQFFLARLAGKTIVHRFSSPADLFELNPSPAHPILKQLVDSQFTPTEWRIRPQAEHARSRTYNRGG